MILLLLFLTVSYLKGQEPESIDQYDRALGLYRDAHPEFIYVTNGETSALISITLEPELLEITLPEKIQSHHSAQKCEARQAILNKVDEVNTELRNYARSKLEDMTMNTKIVERSDRAVFASLGLAVASGVASGLSGGLIDQLFSRRHSQMRTEIESLKSELELTESQLQSTTVELCILTAELFEAKIESFVSVMKLEIDNKINNLVSNILEKNLDFDQKVKLCQLVNQRATSVACTKVSRHHDFRPTVIRIEPNSNGGLVEIEVFAPLIMQQIEAHKLISVGIPSITNSANILSVARVPKFITPDNYTLDGEINDNIVEADLLQINDLNQFNCLNPEPSCDIMTKRVSVDFLIKTVDKHIIVTSWTKCSFSFEKLGQVKTIHFRLQSRVLPKAQGTLICGGREIKLSSSALATKVQFTNRTIEANHVSGPLASNNPLWDRDHPLSKLGTGFSGTSTSHIILTCLLTSAIVFGLLTLKILLWFKTLRNNVSVV